MAGDHFFEEAGLGGGHVEQRLAFFGLRAEGHEIDRMAGTQGHSHLGFGLETTDARAVTGTRVDHHHRPCAGVDLHTVERQDVQQRVVAGALQVAAVEHQFVRELQQVRLARVHVFDIDVAASAQRVEEQHVAFHRVTGVVGSRQGRQACNT